MNPMFGIETAVNWPDLAKLLSRLALDLAVATVVIRVIYYRLYQNQEYVFIYYTFNVITFSFCFLLQKVATPLGLGLALFGVFGILRYRTEQVRIHDLTYLFIVIGLGVLNGIADKAVSVAELLVVDGVVALTTALLEFGSSRAAERAIPMCYDQLELLHPGNEARLLADLSSKTGLPVSRVQVDRFDLLRDAAEITIYSPTR